MKRKTRIMLDEDVKEELRKHKSELDESWNDLLLRLMFECERFKCDGCEGRFNLQQKFEILNPHMKHKKFLCKKCYKEKWQKGKIFSYYISLD